MQEEVSVGEKENPTGVIDFAAEELYNESRNGEGEGKGT